MAAPLQDVLSMRIQQEHSRPAMILSRINPKCFIARHGPMSFSKLKHEYCSLPAFEAQRVAVHPGAVKLFFFSDGSCDIIIVVTVEVPFTFAMILHGNLLFGMLKIILHMVVPCLAHSASGQHPLMCSRCSRGSRGKLPNETPCVDEGSLPVQHHSKRCPTMYATCGPQIRASDQDQAAWSSACCTHTHTPVPACASSTQI